MLAAEVAGHLPEADAHPGHGRAPGLGTEQEYAGHGRGLTRRSRKAGKGEAGCGRAGPDSSRRSAPGGEPACRAEFRRRRAPRAAARSDGIRRWPAPNQRGGSRGERSGEPASSGWSLKSAANPAADEAAAGRRDRRGSSGGGAPPPPPDGRRASDHRCSGGSRARCPPSRRRRTPDRTARPPGARAAARCWRCRSR